jgi:hypothetical protein
VDARLPQAQVHAICRQIIEILLSETPDFSSILEPQVTRVE